MVENSNLEKRLGDCEKRLGDLERRHNQTRELLVDVLSITVAGSAVFYLNPERVITRIIDVVVAYAVMRRLARWLLERWSPEGDAGNP
jgi:hypothetical protein